jgi:adenylate cyclase
MVKKEKPPPKPPPGGDRGLAAEEIQKQLQRILSSPEFHASDRQQKFLEFVVTETLAGRDHEIKGYTVATRVFGRRDDFDQAIDPIVSIQANNLRRALERYYLVAGKGDPIHIDIPKGTYVPTFHEQTGVESDETALSTRIPDVTLKDRWPSVLIRPFQNLTGDREKDFLGTGLAIDLAVELSRNQEIRVLSYGQKGETRRVSDDLARFVIDGSFRQDREGIRLTVQLADTKTNTTIWADTHRCGMEATQLMAFEEEVSSLVAVKIAGEYGIISRTLSLESRGKPPDKLKTYEAILRYNEYDRTLNSDSFLRALEALENASRIEPGCGQVWSKLGRLYGNIYSLEFPGFETALEKAIQYAQRGTRLNPENQRARAILGLVLMFSNEIPGALAEAEKALALNPNSLLLLDGIGYLFTLLGEWERGTALIRKIIQANPFYGLYVHYALWEDWIRQKEYERAHLETLNFSRTSVFWEPLMKAATFGHLERFEEGKRAVNDLLKLKPNFPTRGRILIGHYIKFEEIVERVIDGLSKVGLKIE